MTKLSTDALLLLDKAVRRFRQEVEESAKSFATERGDALATPTDIQQGLQQWIKDSTPIPSTAPETNP